MVEKTKQWILTSYTFFLNPQKYYSVKTWICLFFQALYVVILTTDISVCPIRKHKLVSPDLVQMKVLTGALESQQQDNPQKGNCFADGGRTPFTSSYPSWLIFLLFCFFLVSLSLPVPWDSTCSPYRYLCVSQHSLKFVKWHIYCNTRFAIPQKELERATGAMNTIEPYYKASRISKWFQF